MCHDGGEIPNQGSFLPCARPVNTVSAKKLQMLRIEANRSWYLNPLQRTLLDSAYSCIDSWPHHWHDTETNYTFFPEIVTNLGVPVHEHLHNTHSYLYYTLVFAMKTGLRRAIAKVCS